MEALAQMQSVYAEPLWMISVIFTGILLAVSLLIVFVRVFK